MDFYTRVNTQLYKIKKEGERERSAVLLQSTDGIRVLRSQGTCEVSISKNKVTFFVEAQSLITSLFRFKPWRLHACAHES